MNSFYLQLHHVNFDDIQPEFNMMLAKSGVDLLSNRDNIWEATLRADLDPLAEKDWSENDNISFGFFVFDTWRCVRIAGNSKDRFILSYDHYNQLASLKLKVLTDSPDENYLSFYDPLGDELLLIFEVADREKMMTYFNMISNVQRQLGINTTPLLINELPA